VRSRRPSTRVREIVPRSVVASWGYEIIGQCTCLIVHSIRRRKEEKGSHERQEELWWEWYRSRSRVFLDLLDVSRSTLDTTQLAWYAHSFDPALVVRWYLCSPMPRTCPIRLLVAHNWFETVWGLRPVIIELRTGGWCQHQVSHCRCRCHHPVCSSLLF
jgi:hypothetical protein